MKAKRFPPSKRQPKASINFTKDSLPFAMDLLDQKWNS